jgi:DNA-binding CsgD family transcriptional regulator
MQRLPQTDWDKLNGAIRDLYAQPNLDSLSDSIVNHLLELVPSDHACYNELDLRGTGSRYRLTVDMPEIAKRAPAWQALIGQHPNARYLERTHDPSTHQIAEFVSRREFHRLPLYNEFYRWVEIEHQLIFCVKRPERLYIAVAVSRSSKEFTSRENARMEALRPHFEQAYMNTRAFGYLQSEAGFQMAALSASGASPVLVGNSGQVLWVTPDAEHLLQKYFDDRPRTAGRLPKSLSRWLEHERRRLAQPAFQLPAAPFQIARGEARLTVRFRAEPNGCLLLLLSEECLGNSPERLRSLGLTPRETELLHWLAEGKGNSEIAMILGMNRRTVEKHFENIFAKLGVESRAAALRRTLEALGETRTTM